MRVLVIRMFGEEIGFWVFWDGRVFKGIIVGDVDKISWRDGRFVFVSRFVF